MMQRKFVRMTYICILMVPAMGLFLVEGFAQQKIAEVPSPAVGEPYPLGVCAVSGKELGSMGEPVVYDHEGREIRFCCEGCITAFQNNADQFLAAVDKAIIEQQIPYYPEEICLNSRETWGDAPIDRVFRNRLLRFCCLSCGTEVMAEIAKSGTYLPELNAQIIEQQGPSYPLEECVVSGRRLGEDSVNYVVGNRLIRLCCGECVAAFNANPTQFTEKLPPSTGQGSRDQEKAASAQE